MFPYFHQHFVLPGAFRSAIGGTQQALKSLQSTTEKLQSRQAGLTQAMARYGQTGIKAAGRMNHELQQVGRTLERLQSQQARLSNAAARSQALRNQRMNLYAQGAETYGQARAVYSVVSPAIKQSMAFDDKQIDMQITAKYDDKTRDDLGKNIREWSLEYNQLQDEMQDAAGTLISNNIDSLDDIRQFMPDIARGATATRTAASEWAEVAAVWGKAMNGKASEFRSVQNIMAYAGDQGSFEISDQVKWLKELAPMMNGVAEGKNAIAEIGASLQIARRGAGNADAAANNFKNFLTKIFAEDTQKQFEDVGINLKSSLMSHQAKGVAPIEAMMHVIQEYLAKKSPEAVEQFKAAMSMKDDGARDAALASLASNFGLGELFADQQVMAFIRPMMQNMDDYRSIRDGALKAADNDMLAASYDKRLKSPLEMTKKLVVSSQELMLTLGKQLTPAFISVTQEILPLLQQFNTWIAMNPGLVQGVAKAVGCLLLFKASMIGVRMAINLCVSPIANLWHGFVFIQTAWTRLQVALAAGGKLHGLTRLFSALGRGALSLGKILAGGLFRGVMMAARAVMFLGRALLMNPIGLIITGIALAAYLIYRYWGPISGFFKRLWTQVTTAFRGAWSNIKGIWGSVTGWFSGIWAQIKTAFSGGIGGVAKLITNWSPLGLFYKAFAGVMKYFGIDMPKNFTDFGGNLISGLVSGISNKLESAKETIVNFGNSIKSWFTSVLDMHSPSRVFIGYGDNIAQGAAIGINRSAPDAISASQQMAAALIPPLPDIRVPGLDVAAMPEIAPVTDAIAPPFNPLLPKVAPPVVPTVPPAAGMALAGAAGAMLSRPKPLPPVPPKPAAPVVPELPKSTAPAAKGRNASAHVPGQSSGVNVTFAPQITIKGAASTTEGEITPALKLSLHELEKMMERIMARRERREYA
ncbi:phage tail tape measure protein [Escherichia albertii]|nr:phage tail tape measure protein [Escherichia albertii]QST40036.1 phage tail tape measure protein [Escherichia albertii]